MPAPKRLKSPQPHHEATRAYNRIAVKTKADDPARYTKHPHEYGDILISGGKLGGALQRDILYWIERHTWGTILPGSTPSNPKRPEWARLSLGTLAKLCQSWDDGKLRPAERKSIAVALADLEKRGIIEARERKGCGKTVTKMYKLTPDNWKKAKPYEPPTAKALADAEAEVDAEDGEETQPAEAIAGPESIVQPGKVSRPQPLSVKPSKDAPAVTVRVAYRSQCDVPLTLRASSGANGRIQVTISPAKGEGLANDCSRVQPQPKTTSVDSKGDLKRQELFAAYKTVLDNVMMSVWGSAPNAKFVWDVITRAKSAPIEWFERLAVKKFRRPESFSRFSSGILLNLADDAASAYALWNGSQAAPDRQARKMTAEELAELERLAKICPLCNDTGTMQHRLGPRVCECRKGKK